MQEAQRRRGRSIESRFRRVILVPIAAVTAVWLVVSGYLAYGAVMQYAAVKDNDDLLTPAAIALTAVMDERSETAAYLENPEETEDGLQDARAESDERMEHVLNKFEDGLSYSPERVQDRIHALEQAFSEIDDVRDTVDAGNASRSDVLDFYNGLSRAGVDLFDEQSRANPSKEVVGPGLSASYAFRAVDTLARADAQLARAFATNELSAADQAEFTRLIGSYHETIDSLNGFIGPEQQRGLDDLRGGSDWDSLTQFEEDITTRTINTTTDPATGDSEEDLSLPVNEDEWRAVYTPVKETLTDLGADQAMWAATIQEDQATSAIALAVGGSAGIAVLGIAVFVYTTRSGRITVTRLRRLRDETHDLTERGLPEILEEASESGRTPLDIEALRVSGEDVDDEIGQVARSFNASHNTAVNAAIQQTEMRQGINRVFLNIAHRSQTLVHRQLKLLDKMERDQEDPNRLTELFKLDHLATRSRRNAENLLILGGETPGRTFQRPMPLIDVLRGAISESGDYTRVQRGNMARVSLSGPAVADVIHLVAELVDNATSFSPPHTQVKLSSEQVGKGVALEIEDRGLGMDEAGFEAANTLLAEPPEFDVMRLDERTRLGLFVISHLAHRHNISVQLRGSPYGGIQAIVLLPSGIVVNDAPPFPDTGLADATEVTEVPPAPAPVDSGHDAPDTSRALTDGSASASTTSTVSNAASTDQPSPATGEFTASGLPKRPRYEPEQPATSNGSTANVVPETEESAGPRPALPKRTPQANMAPQLYDTPIDRPDQSAGTGTQVSDDDRSDRLRRNMAAFQQGTRRGRLERRDHTIDTEKDS